MIRLSLRNATNSDISTFLIPWYEQIKSNGGIWGGLGQPAHIQGGSTNETLAIYTGNVGLYNEIAMNYPSFGVLLCSAIENDNISLFKGAAILVTIGVLGIHMYIWSLPFW